MLPVFMLVLAGLAFAGGEDPLAVDPSLNFARLQFTAFANPMDAMLAADDDAQSDSIHADINFPARPMLMSLAIPGLGQLYNKSPWWKTALFASIEIGGIYAWSALNSKAEDKRLEYEQFADDHWSLAEWVRTSGFLNAELFPEGVDTVNNIYTSTHHLTIVDNGIFYSSSELYTSPLTDDMRILRDRDFYENIGKYDQFVGGWDDAYDGNDQLWWETEKEVEDSTEIILMTDNKDNYLDMRFDHNQLLKYAGFTVSAIMFNHVVSAIEAVWSSQSAAREAARERTEVGLLYNRNARYGIGGISLAVHF